MNTYSAYYVGMKERQSLQYTIRQIPPQVDKRLRQKAREAGKSLNEVVVSALKQEVGLTEQPIVYHDLDRLSGSWENSADFDSAIYAQHAIDPEIWK